MTTHSALSLEIIFYADALATVVEGCKPGAKVVDLCDMGDKYINEYVPLS